MYACDTCARGAAHLVVTLRKHAQHRTSGVENDGELLAGGAHAHVDEVLRFHLVVHSHHVGCERRLVFLPANFRQGPVHAHLFGRRNFLDDGVRGSGFVPDA